MKTSFELAQIINPKPNEFDIKLVNGIIDEYKSEIIKEIDDMIAEHQKEISPYIMDDVTDTLNELKNKFKE